MSAETANTSQYRVIRVFIASPSDLGPEREAFQNVVALANRVKAHSLACHLEALGWEATRPGRGRPQGLINPEIENCDLFIAVFWKRWGTATGSYSSGTVEEIEFARRLAESSAGRPEMWLYFKALSDDDLAGSDDQLEQVVAFRRQVEVDQSYKFHEFESSQAWQHTLLVHLCDWLDDTAPVITGMPVPTDNRPPSSLIVERGAVIHADGNVILGGSVTIVGARDEDGERSPTDGSGYHAAIDDAVRHIEAGKPEVARDRLETIRRRSWDRLSERERFRVMANIGNTYLMDADTATAARFFLEAKQYQPDDEAALAFEALAYEFIGQHERSFELAEAMIDKFPNNARARMLWVRNAPEEMSFHELENSVPLSLRDEVEVAGALSQRASRSHEPEKALHYARQAAELEPSHYETVSQLGAAILELEREQGTLISGQGLVPRSPQSVLEAIELLSSAIALAQKRGRLDVVPRFKLNRALAHRLLNRDDEADSDIDSAYSEAPTDPDIFLQYAILLNRRGEYDRAIALLEGRGETSHPIIADLLLAEWLRHRATSDDLVRASKSLQVLLPALEGEAQELRYNAAQLLCATLSDQGKYDEALSAIRALPAQFISPTARSTIEGFCHLRAGATVEASNAATTAIQLRPEGTDREELQNLAILLQSLGRYADALAIWKDLVEPTHVGSDTYNLLSCATQVSDDDLILTFCKKLRSNGVFDSRCIQFETSVLAEYNEFDGAVQIFQEAIRVLPNDKMLRLGLSELAIRCERAELVETDPSLLPTVEEVDPRIGPAVVRVLKRGRDPLVAVRYAYSLLRLNDNFNRAEAHMAFAMALLPVDGPEVMIENPLAVGAGAAVAFRLRGSDSPQWIVIEDEFPPKIELEEISPDHPLARAMDSKGVGDTFVLAEGPQRGQTAEIVEILHKFRYRIRNWFANVETWFPEQEFIRSFSIPRAEDGQVDEAGFVEQLRSITGDIPARIELAEETYAKALMPIHLLAQATNQTTFQATWHIAFHSRLRLRCSLGTRDELESGRKVLAERSLLIVDSTALATLSILDVHVHLVDLPFDLVVSSGTMQELRGLKQRGLSDDWNRKLSSLLQWIETHCKIEGGGALAKLGIERRNSLLQLVGQATAESIAIASEMGGSLWTDDLAVALVAHEELNVERVWTRLVLDRLVDAGLLKGEIAFAAASELIVRGYEFTHLVEAVILFAAEAGHWVPDTEPLASVLGQFANSAADRKGTAALAARLLFATWRTPRLTTEQREHVTLRLLDRLTQRPDGRPIIGFLLASIDKIFGEVDVVSKARVSHLLRVWLQM